MGFIEALLEWWADIQLDGLGEVGSNGSIHFKQHATVLGQHWTVRHRRDGQRVADIGKRGGHPGHFRVAARFPSQTAALQALDAARASIQFDDKTQDYFVDLDVPAVPRTTHHENLPYEVQVQY